jgi:transcriptional regulator with XRE-family HTH domain
VRGDLQRRLGLNLREYRRARGISQEDFADVFGHHRTYMGALERGEQNISLQNLEKLAERLEMDPLELLREPAEDPLAP